MPYRIDLPTFSDLSLDQLITLGALDVDVSGGGLAAIMPDGVGPAAVAAALGTDTIAVSPAVGRDDGSVWVLRPREVRIGRLTIAPKGGAAAAAVLKLCDSAAFGTGLHPTTALCLEAIEWIADIAAPQRALDVGTGSGVLALAALTHGAERALALDLDPEAISVAAANARLNGFSTRIDFLCGGPEAVGGAWPLVLANILAAPLMEMAPVLAPRVAHRGHLVLSGIAASVAPEVETRYINCGMRRIRADARGGWTALVMTPSW